MSDFIGPPLPPELQQRPSASQGADTSTNNPEAVCSYGPSLPPQDSNSPNAPTEVTASIGPKVPPREGNKPSPEREIDNAEPSSYGPCLPPGFAVDVDPCDQSTELRSKVEQTAATGVVGPALPPGFGGIQEEEEEEDIIGPMPIMGGAKASEDEKKKLLRDIESRSKAMRDRLTGQDQEESSGPTREDWMLVLPAEIKPGLGARKFRTGRTDCGDRSVWTDTPADRLRKAKEAQENRLKDRKKEPKVKTTPLQSARDREISEYVTDYNKNNRSESLMDMHKKRRREESSKDGGATERKPFNRDTDLEVPTSLITPAKRKALMKDSKHSLQSKFTHGSSSFL